MPDDQLDGPRADPRRTGRRASVPAWLAVAVIVGLVLWGSCYELMGPSLPRKWKDDAFEVSGEFRADGSCTVSLDGQPIAGADTTRTRYEIGSIIGASPEGTVVHVIRCGRPTFSSRDPVENAGNFTAWVARPRDGDLAPGRYRVVLDGALESGDSTAFESYFEHARFKAQRAYLVAYQGYVRVTRADSSVVGSFRTVARRKRHSPFD